MKFLTLRMTGALQSWSPSSRFTTRTAGRYPTLSGTAGIVLSALGYDRDNPQGIAELAGIKQAVRIDTPGAILRDYHTVEYKPGQKKLTDRYYLQDAKFYALLYFPEEKSDFLERAAEAMKSPTNILYLGRKSCIPSTPIFAGMVESENIAEALHQLPYLGNANEAGARKSLRLEAWVPGSEGTEQTIIPDVPLNFDSRSKEYASRLVSKISISVPNPFYDEQHDPLAMLEEA